MQKKILYLIPRFTTGGAEMLVLQYAKHFKQAGFDVAVASVVGGGELVKEFEKAGITVLVSQNKTLGSWRKLKKFYCQYSPDIVHSHVFSADLAGYLLVRKKTKWISTQHNVGNEHSSLRQMILQFILKKTNKIVAVSEAVEDFCKQDLKLKNNIVLIKNGIETKKWLALSSDILNTNKLKLATIGRLEKQKNHEFLFQSLSGLETDWELNIFGAGSLEKSLKKLASDLKITEKIKWQGIKTNLITELKNIDVVIQPSLWEGMSLVIMEAMTAERLVITSQTAGRGLIENNKTGVLLDDFNEKKWLEVLNKISVQKDWARNLARQGREYAKNNFDIAKHLEDLEKIYHDV